MMSQTKQSIKALLETKKTSDSQSKGTIITKS